MSCRPSAALAAVGIVAIAQTTPPTVRGSDVTFVAAGDRSDAPRIVADFNGWNGGEMTPSADGRTFTLSVGLDPAARIEYLIAYRDRFVLDPGNPLSVPAPAGPPRSELRMPAYRPPGPLAPPRLRGTVETVLFESRRGERRRLRVYAPPAARRPLSVLYVHDGDIFLEKLERRRLAVRYAELPQGHNHTAFRAHLPALLRELLGHRSRAPTKAESLSVRPPDSTAPGSPTAR